MKCMISEMRLLRDDMAKLQAEFINRFEGLTSKVYDFEARLIKLEEKERENALLKTQVTDLQIQLNNQAQQLLSSELEVMGLPETPNENQYHIILTTAAKLGMKLEEADVNFVSRAGPRRKDERTNSQPRPLVVSFVRRAKREEFLKHGRSRRSTLSSRDIVPTAPDMRVFINERLTSDGRRLFRDTREWVKENNFKYCWTRGGLIYVRKYEGKDGSPALQIRSHGDLQKLSEKRDN